MSAKIRYTIFYVALILFLITVGGYIPVDTIEGVTVEQLTVLAEPVVLPPTPNLADWVIFPFAAIYSTIVKFMILMAASPVHQGLTIITLPFTAGFIIVIVLIIRGN